MGSFFKDLKSKKVAEMREQEQLQKAREERLKELEMSGKKEGFHIPNPIQTMKDKKEIKTLKKEIAVYEESKRNKKIVIGLSIMFLILMGFVGIMAILEEPETNDNDIANNDSNVVFEAESEEHTAYEETEMLENEVATEKETSEVQDDTEENTFIPTLLASDLNVSTKTDYAHTDTETIFLGTGEGVTITIKSSVASLTTENILLLYDDSHVNVNIQEKTNDSRTYLEIYLSAKKICETQFAILTAEEYIAYGEECEGYILDIRQLDSAEGRIVYVTSRGEKFHYSKACAGDSAYETTYKDAVGGGYEPCGNCVE